MNLCNPNHPEHFAFSNGRWVGFGGYIGDMALHQTQPFFNGVIIHRRLDRVVAECDGKFYPLFENRSFCCKTHQLLAELLKVARQPWAIQTHPYPVLDKNNLDAKARAFLLCRKLAKNKIK